MIKLDKSLIQKRTKTLLERTSGAKEFTKELQNLLKAFVDKAATQNYQRIIPDTGKFYGVPKPVLVLVAAEIGKFLQKEPEKAKKLLKIIWNEGSFEAKQIAGKSLDKFGPENPKICLDFVSSVLTELDNWSVCDNLAMFGVRSVVLSNSGLVLPLSEKWIKSSDKWIRRFGVVTLLGYGKIKTTNKVFQILDMVMPKMGGRETFFKIKEINPGVKALLSTGYSQNEKAKDILENGAMGFIQKPYQLDVLLSKIRSILDADVDAA